MLSDKHIFCFAPRPLTSCMMGENTETAVDVEILHQFFLLICERSKQWQGGNYAAMESLLL